MGPSHMSHKMEKKSDNMPVEKIWDKLSSKGTRWVGITLLEWQRKGLNNSLDINVTVQCSLYKEIFN